MTSQTGQRTRNTVRRVSASPLRPLFLAMLRVLGNSRPEVYALESHKFFPGIRCTSGPVGDAQVPDLLSNLLIW